jgi:hypothetical protein
MRKGGQTDGQTDRHDEANSRFSQLRKPRLKALCHGSGGKPPDLSARVHIVLRVITCGNYAGQSSTGTDFSQVLLSLPVLIISAVVHTHISATYSRHYISLAFYNAFE